MKSFQELVNEASLEIATKSRETIEMETAYKWAARAMASYMRFQKTGSTFLLFDAEDYRHEALEHAAMAGASVLNQVHKVLDVTRGACMVQVRCT
jgi:hypothetical protein